jgi:hypothetical protein
MHSVTKTVCAKISPEALQVPRQLVVIEKSIAGFKLNWIFTRSAVCHTQCKMVIISSSIDKTYMRQYQGCIDTTYMRQHQQS